MKLSKTQPVIIEQDYGKKNLEEERQRNKLH